LPKETKGIPTSEKYPIVIWQLLAADSPLRFKDLLAACKGHISKRTLVKTLKLLETEQLIFKKARSHKFVEYELNPGNTLIAELRSKREIGGKLSEQNIASGIRSADLWQQLLRYTKTARQRRKFIQQGVGWITTMLCLAELDVTLTQASFVAEKGASPPWLEAMWEEVSRTDRLTFVQPLVVLLKADPKTATEALNKLTKPWKAKLENYERKLKIENLRLERRLDVLKSQA
jgi:DNA-binding HxlR family transcriptional regulator